MSGRSIARGYTLHQLAARAGVAGATAVGAVAVGLGAYRVGAVVAVVLTGLIAWLALSGRTRTAHHSAQIRRVERRVAQVAERSAEQSRQIGALDEAMVAVRGAFARVDASERRILSTFAAAHVTDEDHRAKRDLLDARREKRLDALTTELVAMSDDMRSRIEAAERRLLGEWASTRLDVVESVETASAAVSDLRSASEDTTAAAKHTVAQTADVVRDAVEHLAAELRLHLDILANTTVPSAADGDAAPREHQVDANAVSKMLQGFVDLGRDVESMLQIQRVIEPRAVLPSTGGFAITARNLAYLLDLLAAAKPKRVLELGSGTSTVYVGYMLERQGGHIVSIDHLEAYAESTRAAVARHGLQATAEVRIAELVDGEYDGETRPWYDPAAFADLREVDFLIVDGPPGRTHALARHPALQALQDQLADGALVVLDDMHRRAERETARRWLAEVPGLTKVEGSPPAMAIFRYHKPQAALASTAEEAVTVEAAGPDRLEGLGAATGHRAPVEAPTEVAPADGRSVGGPAAVRREPSVQGELPEPVVIEAALVEMGGGNVPTCQLPGVGSFTPPRRPGATRYAADLRPDIPLEALLVNKQADTLLVSFHGATDRSKYVLPRFEWLRTLNATEHSVLYFSDPMLHLHPRLSLAWYTGWQDDELYPVLAQWAMRAAEASEASNVVFFGSSGGGLAALQTATYVPGSLALAFNPQAAIINYRPEGRGRGHQRRFVDAVMPQLAPGGYDLLPPDADWSAPLGQHTSALRRYENSQANRVLYFQNTNDYWHVRQHYGPFKEVVDGGPNASRVRFVEYAGPEGHKPPHKSLLLEAIDQAVAWLGDDSPA